MRVTVRSDGVMFGPGMKPIQATVDARKIVDEAQCSEKELPAKRDMAKNLLRAASAIAREGARRADSDERERRFNICKTECEWFRPSDKRCANCGCWLEYKTTLEAWHCPINKW